MTTSSLSSRSHPTRKIFIGGPQGAARWGYYFTLVLIPLVLAGYAAYQTWFFYTRHGLVAAIYRPRLYWLGAAIAALVALILFIRLRWRSRAYLLLEPHNIVVHLPPKRAVTLAWEDVNGVQLRLFRNWWPLPRRWQGDVILHLRDGSQIRLDNRFPDLPKIAQEIQRRWYSVRLPALRGAWATNDPLDFGKLQISPQDLRWREHTYPWRTIRGVTIQRGRLVIELTTRRPLRIPLRHIFNPHALLWWLHEEAKR